jgi:alpha-1,3-rhamnosyl/mannosyltransferase
MRVGIDYRPALLQRTGIGRYARELVRALVRLPDPPPLALFADAFARASVPREELGIAGSSARLYRRRIPGRAIHFLGRWGLGVENLVGPLDLFHYTDFVYPPLRGTPYVATIFDASFAADPAFHGEADSRRLRERAERIVRGARWVLVPSTFAAGEVVLRLRVHPSQVVVTPLGVDHVRPPAKPADRNEPYFLTVGTIEPRKNHLRALEAFERLVAQGLPHRWVVAGGRGWLFEPFFERLSRSPARARVDLLGAVPEEKLLELVAGAALLLYPSLYEGFGLPPLEAMALGTPVVTSAAGALMENGEGAALLVDPNDAQAIAEGVVRLLEDEALRDQLVRAGRERAAGFTWESCAKATAAAYAQSLESARTRPLSRLF